MTESMAQQQSTPSIELKGSLFTLSVLHLTDNDLTQLGQALKDKIAQAPSFFYRAPVVVSIDKVTQPIDFNALKTTVEAQDFVLVGISGGNNEQKQQAKSQGLAVLSYSDNKKPTPPAQQAQVAEKAPEKIVEKVVEKVVEKIVEKQVVKPVYQSAKVVRNTVRSGQQIYAEGTDLIVIGSVGHGAEIIADGNIHVYGTLRGKAIAGAKGDSNAKIYCQNIQADLVSICGNYMMSEALQTHTWEKPATVELLEEKLVITELN